MKEIREEYKAAKVALFSEQSEKNYKRMMSACYNILAYHRELWQEDGFADVLQIYEKTALSFWRRYKTVESLCHLIYFYSDWKILMYLNRVSDMKQHLLKGMEYVQQYHNMEDADYSACIYIQQYLCLCEKCGTGEAEEQLSYAKKAYDLAKQCLQKYQTDQMLDQYKKAAMERVWYYRMDGQEEAAAAVERECEELLADINKGITRSIQIEQGRDAVPKEEDIYDRLEDMRCDILPYSEEIVEKHWKEIFYFIKICLKVHDIACYKGLIPVMQEAEKLDKREDIQYGQILAYGINRVCDGEAEKRLVEKMLDHFSLQREERYMRFILYMTIRFILMIQCGVSKNLMEKVLFSMIPPKERNKLEKYLEFKLL